MFYQTIFAGILGSLAMLFVLYLITFSKIANADMVRALGSLITGKLKGSTLVGLVIYFIGGILFSFLYFYIFRIFPTQETARIAFLGAFGGFVHGGLVSFSLVISVSGRHPVKRFQNVGFQVALAHIAGHIAYGLTLALTYLNLTKEQKIFPNLSSFEPYTIYILVAFFLAIIMMSASAIYTQSHRAKKEQDILPERGKHPLK
jgi:hypothetical protein